MTTTDWDRAAKFHQIGIVVADLDDAISEMGAALGIQEESWERIDTRPGGFEHTEPGTGTTVAQTRYARARSGATTYQLIEPLSPGTVWDRWRNEGVTLFALGYFVRDVDARTEELRSSGAEVLATGTISEGDDRYAYSFVRLPRSELTIELMGPAGEGV